MSVLIFDFGTRHIGVAAVVVESRISLPIATLVAKRGRPNLQAMSRLIQEWSPTNFIVGLPLNIDQTDSPMCEAVRRFGSFLEDQFIVPVVYVDERLSTHEANFRSSRVGELERRRNSSKTTQRKSRTRQNLLGSHALAAQVIGETWLAQQLESNSLVASSE